MKLGEALSELKKQENRLTRRLDLRKDNVYVEKDKTTAFDPKTLSSEIDKKIDEIRALKIKIQGCNLVTTVDGGDLTLAEALIKVNDLRRKIARLSNLFDRDSFLHAEKVAQLDEVEVENNIETLQNEEVRLYDKIQLTNWTTQLGG